MHSAQTTRTAALKVTVPDAATGKPTAARVRIEDSSGTRPRVTGAVTISETAIPSVECASCVSRWITPKTASKIVVRMPNDRVSSSIVMPRRRLAARSRFVRSPF